ncbi:uncharacterized protein [Amphiura filiformis]|uniref:uncharacterized protein n=1 Tax=Amphiura filiformis TaxID=82378 RepID=UPI003B21FC76
MEISRMADKRKLTQDGYQNKPKRFKPSSTKKHTGQTKPPAAKSIKRAAGAIAAGKKGIKAAKWKKKQKYVFKRAKSTPGTKESYRKIQDDTDRTKTDQNLESEKDVSVKKKKKKKRRKKNPKQLSVGDNQVNSKASENGQPLEKAEKDVSVKKNKKKRKKKKPKQLSVGGNQMKSKTSENGKPLENATSTTQTLSVPNESTKDSFDKSLKKKKKKKGKGSKLGKDGKDQQKDGNKSDVVLPKEPEDVSANWKAMLSKLQKDDSSKSKKKQDMHHRGKGGHFKDKTQTSKPPDIWFDDVDPELLRTNDASSSVAKTTKKNESESGSSRFVTDGTEDGPTKCVALDCEMVGAGRDGKDNLLARVSIVNQYGHCLYDKFVAAREDVTDYRTWVSGVRPKDLETAEDFLTVQKEVADLLKGRILVGHALQNDMKVLFLDHPKRMVRDTFRYEPFRQMFKSRRPGLKGLVEKILNVDFQKGEHNSVEDAQAVMKLYMLHRKNWEASLKMKPIKRRKEQDDQKEINTGNRSVMLQKISLSLNMLKKPEHNVFYEILKFVLAQVLFI